MVTDVGAPRGQMLTTGPRSEGQGRVGADRPWVSLGVMPEVIESGVREMLAPFRDRLAVRGQDEAPLADDLRLFDPSWRSPDLVATRTTATTTAGTRAAEPDRLVFYTWRPATTEQAALARLDDRYGARLRGWLCMQRPAAHLVSALERIQRGEVVIDARRQVRGPSPDAAQTLTIREREILGLIASGLSNLEIAQRTFLSPNTIKSYIKSAYRKVGARSRSEAVLWGLRHRVDLSTGLRDPARPPGAEARTVRWPTPHRPQPTYRDLP
jgi:DNA-binding CsgD family transcriptional regulator